MSPRHRVGDRGTAELDAFFERSRRSNSRVLLLDYDGTLAPFRVEREAAFPYPGIPALLDQIMDMNTHVALISGRWIKDLTPLLKLNRQPEIWGSHGWERLYSDGRYVVAQPDANALKGLAQADTWSDEIIALGGSIEQKPACLAIHWRGLDLERADRIRIRVLENWTWVARQTGLKVHSFDEGIELRVPGRSKGYAVDTILDESGPDAAVAFLGDDFTDEDAFRALKGKGLGVLVREEFRPTLADVWLRPPGELIKFLKRWIELGNLKQ